MRARLGQHFLINKQVADGIVDSLEIQEGDVVIEIGPGSGALTEILVTRVRELGGWFIGIEKDRGLASALASNFQLSMGSADSPQAFNFQSNSNFIMSQNTSMVVCGDVLEALPEITSKLGGQKYKIIGNIPYYITGQILRIIGGLEKKPETIVLTLQKEVTERVVAKPPKMNLLAASVQFWAEVEFLGLISRREFSPKPQVDSAIVRLKTKKEQKTTIERGKYYRFLKIMFKQPRKTVLNNLKAGGIDAQNEKIRDFFEKNGIEVGARPQDLEVGTIWEMAEAIANNTNGDE